jgi:NADH-quinone oxidoreductase subunit J
VISAVLASSVLAAGTHASTPEAILFWVLAPIAVIAAIGVILSRSAVHSALLLVLTFFCFAVFYVLQDALFLGVVQVIVYTGAIMILFLFVLMLVGVDASDSFVETLRGQRVAAVLLAIGFAGLVAFPVAAALNNSHAVGLTAANAGGNVPGLARLIFTSYVFPFEATSALLIVAALGAMVLGHRERTRRRPTQKELAVARFRGRHPSPLPAPGVFARHDAVDEPALLPSGAPAELSELPDYVAGADESETVTTETGENRP